MTRTIAVRSRFVRALAAVAAAGVITAGLPAAAVAQQGGNGGGGGRGGTPKAQPGPSQSAAKSSILDSVLKRGRSRDWTLKVSVNIHSYQNVSADGVPVIEVMDLKTAAVVFPLNTASGSSELDEENFKGELTFNDVIVDDNPKLMEGYAAGTRLARWELTDKVGREMKLELEIPVTTWSTIFDEKAAAKVVWPASWPPAAASALKPDGIVDSASPAVQALLKGWTGGEDPKKIPPVQLAKFLAGKVLEFGQTSGDGLEFIGLGQLVGVALQPIEETARDGRGSEHDIVVLLAAVYRAAGLPARTVIGYDVSAKKDKSGFLENGGRGGPQKLRAWVEFCLYDEGAQKELWVPVDIVRLRGSSNRMPPLNKPWKYFGAHDELENVIPFAFQYHPPTTVVAHGAFGFWGWLTTPKIPKVTQFLRFDAQTTPKRSSDRTRGRR